MTINIELASFERAEYIGETLRLHGTDRSGNPVCITMGLPQYTALTLDAALSMLNTTAPSQPGPGPMQLAVIQATEVGLATDALRRDPVLVFRHGLGRQSAFLVPRSKIRRLAELLLAFPGDAQPEPQH